MCFYEYGKFIDGNFNRKVNQEASGSTRIGSLYWESRAWLIAAKKLCACCVERVNVYMVSRSRKK